MEIQVLTEIQLKITLIGESISKKVILPQVWLYVDLYFFFLLLVDVFETTERMLTPTASVRHDLLEFADVFDASVTA